MGISWTRPKGPQTIPFSARFVLHKAVKAKTPTPQGAAPTISRRVRRWWTRICKSLFSAEETRGPSRLLSEGPHRQPRGALVDGGSWSPPHRGSLNTDAYGGSGVRATCRRSPPKPYISSPPPLRSRSFLPTGTLLSTWTRNNIHLPRNTLSSNIDATVSTVRAAETHPFNKSFLPPSVAPPMGRITAVPANPQHPQELFFGVHIQP